LEGGLEEYKTVNREKRKKKEKDSNYERVTCHIISPPLSLSLLPFAWEAL